MQALWNSIARRFSRWADKKVWQRLFAAIQEPDWEGGLGDASSVAAHPHAAGQKKSTAQAECLGRSRGGLTPKIHAAVDALGKPAHVHLSGGQEADCQHFERLAETLPAKVGAVVGDKGYDTDAVLACMQAREAEAVVPAKRNRKQERPIDQNLYKDRNKAERFFLKIKQNRAVATRYDKKAVCFLAVVQLASLVCWLMQQVSTPAGQHNMLP